MKNLKKFGELDEALLPWNDINPLLTDFESAMDKVSRGFAQSIPTFDIKVDVSKKEITATRIDDTEGSKGSKLVFGFKKYIK